MALRKVLDAFFCGYFVFQIFGTILLDSQAVFPQWMYPEFIRDIGASYRADYKDVFVTNVTAFPWYLAICCVEFTLEIPFFFVAAYAYYKGAAQCPWIRIPSLMYGVHTATAVLGVLFVICLEDFSHFKTPAPRTYQDRKNLFRVYFMFFASCICLILDTCMSSAYVTDKKKED